MAKSALNKAPGDGPDGLDNPVPTWSFVPFQALPGTIALPLSTCSQPVTISQKSDTKGHKFKYFRAVGGILRRIENDEGEIDEVFSRDLKWEFSSLLYSAEHGDLTNDFAPITEEEAAQIMERIRAESGEE
jgi:hypothetical protein